MEYPMGIVKISDALHKEARISSKAMTRSINAQAEHWMKIGMLVEANPSMSYADICKLLLDEARKKDKQNPLNSDNKNSIVA